MAQPLVLDIAWARPTVAQIKATGAVGVVRYFSNDDSKDLHASEVVSYGAAGLLIGTVFETSAGRAVQGAAAGSADAHNAWTQRGAVSLPVDMPVHFAVDTDTTWAKVAPYFAAVAAVMGKENTGVYGGYAVIEGAYAAGYRILWQTLAWSGGRVSGHATLYQYGGTVLSGGADRNHALAADWGQYPRPEAPNMTLAKADLEVLVNTDNVLAGPADAADHATNPNWTWASHITNTTSNVRTMLAEVRAFATAATATMKSVLSQAQTNGSSLTAANTALSAQAAKLDALAAAVGEISATGITQAQSDALADKIVADLAARLQA